MKLALIRYVSGYGAVATALLLTAIAVLAIYLVSATHLSALSTRFVLITMPLGFAMMGMLAWTMRHTARPQLALVIGTFGLLSFTALLLTATLTGYCRLT